MKTIHDRPLSNRAKNTLNRNGILTLTDYCNLRSEGIQGMRGIGKKTMLEIIRDLPLAKAETKLLPENEVDQIDEKDIEEVPIEFYESQITRRGVNALKNNGISNSKDLVNFPSYAIGAFKGVGGKVERLVIELQNSLKDGKKDKLSDADFGKTPVEELEISDVLKKKLNFNSISTINKAVELVENFNEDFYRNIGKSDIIELKKALDIANKSFSKELGASNLFEEISSFFSSQNSDETKSIIFEARFLNGQTLEEVGEQIGVTRERVRQIEVEIHKNINLLIDYTKDSLRKNILSQEDLLMFPFDCKLLGCENAFFCHSVCFTSNLRNSLKVPHKYKNNKFQYITASKEVNRDDILCFLDEFYSIMEEKGECEIPLLVYILKEKVPNLDKSFIQNFINKLIQTDHNILHIDEDKLKYLKKKKPKLRSLIEQALKTNKLSMHYSDITALVNREFSTSYDIRRVHNELSANSILFINTGKGTYALADSNYSGLNTSDLVFELLKTKNRPLTPKAVQDYVCSKKDVSPNTVLASLSYEGEKRFVTLIDGRIALNMWKRIDVRKKNTVNYDLNTFQVFEYLSPKLRKLSKFTIKDYQDLANQIKDYKVSTKTSAIRSMLQKCTSEGKLKALKENKRNYYYIN